MVTFNNENIVQGRFPNNEVDYAPLHKIEVPFASDKFDIFELAFESNEDLLNLQVVKKWWDDCTTTKKSKLIIKFFPYSQMDRKMDSHLFSLKYIAQIINDLKFDSISIWDPHSNVLPALLNKCDVKYPVKDFLTASAHQDESQYDLLFFPDNGAAKKYSEILNAKKYRFGNKCRNLETGEIEGYEVVAKESDIAGKKILIIDDLVMGGRTFVEAAVVLRDMGAAQVDLFVTHLMPQSRNFYNTRGGGLLDNVYSADSLNLIPVFNTPEPRP